MTNFSPFRRIHLHSSVLIQYDEPPHKHKAFIWSGTDPEGYFVFPKCFLNGCSISPSAKPSQALLSLDTLIFVNNVYTHHFF